MNNVYSCPCTRRLENSKVTANFGTNINKLQEIEAIYSISMFSSKEKGAGY